MYGAVLTLLQKERNIMMPRNNLAGKLSKKWKNGERLPLLRVLAKTKHACRKALNFLGLTRAVLSGVSWQINVFPQAVWFSINTGQ